MLELGTDVVGSFEDVEVGGCAEVFGGGGVFAAAGAPLAGLFGGRAVGDAQAAELLEGGSLAACAVFLDATA